MSTYNAKDISATAAKWWIEAMGGRVVWNLGQLDKETIHHLNKAARRYQIHKGRARYGCDHGPMKTFWCARERD